ncbi:MocR-like pyridoxine biosynthesis transcription factor PdxR [Aminipila terrae]|uniref:Aminotransferase class I/II-fold pyridoxal phosphate-dependent enzyme n=1 Tax=Aminipila terrae TaxID=2697030 RepID=A0A6P1MP11_9FIRM|nr:PLP-dependent aminotransferase family protein [Aminipila terrae]QHI73416.1 aminotransferase class I/II-fold pyridoxal phosphate-dependent enzyme [Aminipila terrae]
MIVIKSNVKEPIYLQIYDYFKSQIVKGELVEGNKIPSTRNLAESLGISRNTVEAAYQQLCAEGFLAGKAGSGYVVLPFDVNIYNDVSRKRIIPDNNPEKKTNEGHKENSIKYQFQYGKLNIKDFPMQAWKRAVNEALSSCDIECLGAYNDKFGEKGLRVEIMKYLLYSRGVRCQPEQIILTAGTLSALSIICQLYMNQCNEIALEEPCYNSAREAFKNHGMKTIPIPIEEDGISLTGLANCNAKLVYTTPSHQFPTGKVMGINKRVNLIKWADENDAYLIEDDYDSELRYNSRPIPSMQSLDRKGHVIYINTFSKAFAPGLRMSFIVLPDTLLEKYKRNFSRYNCQVSWTEQKAMQFFMQEGNWNRHLRKICTTNKRKHDILMSALHEYMNDRVIIHGNNAGLHILLEVNNGMNEQELINRAGETGVQVYPVSVYWENPEHYKNNMVLVGYSSLTVEEIEDGVRLLQSVWF